MYGVDELDEVIELTTVPQSSIGAPTPAVIATEHLVYLAFYLENTPEDWDRSRVRQVDVSSSDEPIAIIKFQSCYAQMFGPPNDEAFHGHPLAARGLRPYGVFQIRNSSWIRSLTQMNSVHRYHSPDLFKNYKHYVFAFHDSTFECVAERFEVETAFGSMASILNKIAASFN